MNEWNALAITAVLATSLALLWSILYPKLREHDIQLVDLGYRVLPGNLDTADLAMSHSSVHFDRSGFREDVNLVFPIDRLRELESEGLVGSVADYHYSLMGAGWLPQQIEPTIAELAGMLRKDEVDAVCLVPI